jgi:hypothetical protein
METCSVMARNCGRTFPESETPGNFKSLRKNWNSHSTREMKTASHNQHV